MIKIVEDGALTPTAFAAAPVKVVHLLKQVNSTEHGWSLGQFVDEQVIDQRTGEVRVTFPVWLNLARWSYLLQQGGTPQFQDLTSRGPELSTALKASAVLNLMNELGGSSTAPQDLVYAARRDRAIWERQIVELNPSFVVCGGTFWVLEQLEALPGKPLTGPSGMRYSWNGAGPVYMDFVHPANRISHAMMYAWLREAVLSLPFFP